MQVKDVTDAQVLLLCPPDGVACVLSNLITQGVPEKVALRKIEQLVDRAWLEYGVSINYVWLTPLGKTERQALRRNRHGEG